MKGWSRRFSSSWSAAPRRAARRRLILAPPLQVRAHTASSASRFASVSARRLGEDFAVRSSISERSYCLLPPLLVLLLADRLHLGDLALAQPDSILRDS